MSEIKKRILFVNSEIYPYLPETPISKIGRFLPQGIQEHKREIRSFMPRYGCINERKNQLKAEAKADDYKALIEEEKERIRILEGEREKIALQIEDIKKEIAMLESLVDRLIK